ncbi:MAG: hypothetical protein QG566_786 [Patescibacteria group bacterium]|nr:hypothetical protein [Patescibacteria group bacterium]
MLEEDLALNKENNTILKGIRSAQRRAQIMKIVYWIIILGITFGAYYFIQPYIESLMGYYGSLAGLAGEGDKAGGASTIPNLTQIQDLLKQYQGQ